MHPNAQRLGDAYAAFARGDIDSIRNEYFHQDITFHVPGPSPLAGDFRGLDAVLAMFGELFAQTGGNFQIEIHDVLGNDRHVVGITTSHVTRNGQARSYRNIHVAQMKDGKIVEWWEFPEAAAYAEAWG